MPLFSKKKIEKKQSPAIPPMVVAGVGAVTPVGLDWAMSAASVTCQVRRMGQCDYFRDQVTGQPLTVSRLKTLAPDLPLPDRLNTMAVAAAMQALSPLQDLKSTLPLLMSTPSLRPGFGQQQGEHIFNVVKNALSPELDKKHSGIYCTGHTGGIEAVTYAAWLFESQTAEVCLVGGVDSYMDMDCLDWLNAEGRLKKEGNSFGFIPGEGAGFILLCTPTFAQQHQLIPLGVIRSVGFAEEPLPWYSGKATMGEGLTSALSQTFANIQKLGKLSDVTFCDFNGEAWRTTEWEYAYLRTASFHNDPLDLRHPVECWGDVGAACSPLLIGQAVFELFYQYNKYTSALVWSASDTQTSRAACLLECDTPSSKLRSKNTL